MVFTPYDRLHLLDSRGMAFKCENGKEYRINYYLQFSGPGVIKREGERLFWTLFFGGIPHYMGEEEIKDRQKTTLKRMAENRGRIINEITNFAESFLANREEAIRDEEARKKRRVTIEALYDPQRYGLVEHLIRPEVGTRLASGLIIVNTITKIPRQRIIITAPIAEIYCLPE